MTVVACGAGFAGDRIDPAVALAESGLVDCLSLECLAERTIVNGLQLRAVNPELGYDRRLRRRLTPLLPAVADGCKLVSNLGAANPAGAARAIAELARELGLRPLKVAAVLGDDVAAIADDVIWSRPAGGTWLGAHAYIGLESIAKALAEGADVVITGRAADAALFAGPAYADLDGSPDALAGALAVGHLLECSGQVTGGNFEAPGEPPPTAAEFAELGFPIASVSSDGSAEISKLPGTGGRIDRMTCTLQLLYEVHDPARYLTPDAIVDFSGVSFDQIGRDRVRVSGARHLGVPDSLKVSGFSIQPGAVADVEIGFAGTGALRRARIAAETLSLRMERLGISRFGVDIVGQDSLLGGSSRLIRHPPPEARAHVSAVCDSDEMALAVEDEVFALTLSGPSSGGGMRSERRPRIEVVDGLIDRDRVRTEVVWGQAA
ncbi:acyclic terpene utilization AtuA family protein [Conexibacter sp. DBS9H8]|uniref:acyclic terpene utilization AtuA family protein n=1 Tax=Conexibacter sp. DBS9H8 TaxID=2937801 RepID=UPI0021110DD7|nr:acyclic terpene utilization AtuA family protein [Conexibacter sp. DBS9H8]